MPLIEANFIYIKILLLGTLGYVYTLQRPTIHMIRPSHIISTCTKVLTLPKWTYTIYIQYGLCPLLTKWAIYQAPIQQETHKTQYWIHRHAYTNLLLMTLLELGFTHTSSCGCHIQMCEPQQSYYTSCICTILCACMCLHDDMQA